MDTVDQDSTIDTASDLTKYHGHMTGSECMCTEHYGGEGERCRIGFGCSHSIATVISDPSNMNIKMPMYFSFRHL